MSITFLNRYLAKVTAKVSLRTVLIVPVVLPIFVVVGLVGYFSWKNGEKAVNKLVNQLMEEVSDRIQERLNSYLATPDQINKLNKHALDLGQIDIKDLSSMERHFWQQYQVYNWVSQIQFATSDGEFVALAVGSDDTLTYQVREFTKELRIYGIDKEGNRDQMLKSVENFDPRELPWYTHAVKAKGQPVWTKIYPKMKSPTLAITLAQAYYDGGGNLQGVLAVDLTLARISEFLSSLPIAKQGKTFILENTGNLVSSSSTKALFKLTGNQAKPIAAVDFEDPLIKASVEYLQAQFGNLKEIDNTKDLKFKLDGQEQFLQVLPLRNVRGINWLIVVVVPTQDFRGEITQNTRTTVLIYIIALVIAVAIGIVNASWVVQPILRLNASAKNLAKGEWEQRVKVEGAAELGELAKSFNTMAGELQTTVAALEKTNVELEDKVWERTASLTAVEEEMVAVFGAMTDIILIIEVQDQAIENVEVAPTNPSSMYQDYSELIRETIQSFYRYETALIWSKQVWETLETGNRVDFEYDLCVGYDRFWFTASITPISDKSAIWVARDISERKQTEEALRAAEENYRSIFVNAAEGIFQSTPEGVYLSANPALARMYGYSSPEELIYNLKSTELYVNPKRRQDFVTAIKQYGTISNFESQVYRADGQIIWISENVHLVHDEEAQLLYYEGTVENITARKKAESALQQKNQDLANTLRQLRETQEGLIQSEKMAALGQLIAGVAHEVNTPLGAIRSSVNNIADFLEEYLEILPEFFQELSPQCHQYFFALLQQQTKQETALSTREKRKLIRSLKGQLGEVGIEEADYIASTLINIGVYNVAPFLPLLTQEEKSEKILNMAYQLATLRSSTKTIATAADRAAKVVFALKTYGRYDHSGEKTKASIIEGIETVLTIYHNQLKQGIELVKKYGNIPTILCYPDELNQVWTNLVHNAVQAMDNQGELIIDVHRSNSWIEVKVTDSGTGIPLDIKNKIFQPFFTTKPPGEGSGLGLDIVKKIIDKHDGKIEVESVPGKTTFTVLLPIES